MSGTDNKKKRKKRTLAQKLGTVILILLIILAAIILGGFFIVNRQNNNITFGPLAELQEILPGTKNEMTAVSVSSKEDGQNNTAAASLAAEGSEEEETVAPVQNQVSVQEQNSIQNGKTPVVTAAPQNSENGTSAENAAAQQTEASEISGNAGEAQTSEAEAAESGENNLLGSVGTLAHDEDVIVYDGKQYVYNDHLSNYLMLGIDTTGDIQIEKRDTTGGQSDAIYLVSYDRKENTARILAIPRDTMTDIEMYSEEGTYLGHKVDHLTLQYAYGDGKRKSCELACDAVSHLLYEMPILGYAALNTDSIPLLADVVDGVPLTLEDNSLQDVFPEFSRGSEVIITTENAEKFLRYRDTHQHQQALVRMDRQKVFINAFIDKLKKLQKGDPHTVTDVYETLKPHMVTNMGNDVFLDLATAKREGRIETVPGMGVNTELYDEYHVDEKALYELILDMFYKEVES